MNSSVGVVVFFWNGENPEHKKEELMRHLLNPLDFSVEETEQLLDLAGDIEHNLPKYAHVCDGKKLATLFYEPSTRTVSYTHLTLPTNSRV